MKLLYIGAAEKGLWFKEESKKYYLDYQSVEEDTRIERQINEILSIKDVKYMVFHIEQYADPADRIAEAIKRIAAVNNAKAIIYAPGYPVTSEVIVQLLRCDIRNFILGWNLSEQKDQLGKCINGYYDVHDIEGLELIELEKKEEEKEKVHFKNVAVVGCMPRIGTTTQALQIVKYLMLNGYKACYIEFNNHGYVDAIKEWFDVDTDPELGRVTYGSVDMFNDLTKLKAVLKQGYDYYVYDYGERSDTGFNKVSFLERDIQIFVCGGKPSELKYTEKAIESAFYHDALYVFSFVPENDAEDIKNIMRSKKDKTFIAPLCADPFVYSNSDIYKEMIPVEDLTVPEEESEKKSIFKMPGKISKFSRKEKAQKRIKKKA